MMGKQRNCVVRGTLVVGIRPEGIAEGVPKEKGADDTAKAGVLIQVRNNGSTVGRRNERIHVSSGYQRGIKAGFATGDRGAQGSTSASKPKPKALAELCNRHKVIRDGDGRSRRRDQRGEQVQRKAANTARETPHVEEESAQRNREGASYLL